MSTFYIKLEVDKYTKEEIKEMLKSVLPIPEPEKSIQVEEFWSKYDDNDRAGEDW